MDPKELKEQGALKPVHLSDLEKADMLKELDPKQVDSSGLKWEEALEMMDL